MESQTLFLRDRNKKPSRLERGKAFIASTIRADQKPKPTLRISGLAGSSMAFWFQSVSGQGHCLFHNALSLQAAGFDVRRKPPTNGPKMVSIIIATF
jgi:hypothetical protein